MGYGTGETGDAVAAARGALARRDSELADADRQLAEVVSEAHRIANESVRRIEAVAAQIDEAAVGHPSGGPVEGRETARFLIDKQREIEDVVVTAVAEARTKAAALQQLKDSYRAGS